MAALNHLVLVEHHVVAQIVKPEFVVCAVGDVALISLPARVVVHIVQNDADRKPEELVDKPHLFTLEFSQIFVYGDNVDILTGQRVQVSRVQRG